MVMSSKKIGKMVGADVDKALANISASTPKPDMKDDTIKKAAAPQKAQTFAEAFKAARADKGAGKTFTWLGKSYSTNKAGEGAKKTSGRSGTAAPAAAKTSTPTKNLTGINKPTGSTSTPAVNPAFFKKKEGAPTGAAGVKTSAPKASPPASMSFKERQEKKYGKSRPLLLVGEEARKANKGTIGGKAKGGKIDGIAVRGKTRAPMKKGK